MFLVHILFYYAYIPVILAFQKKVEFKTEQSSLTECMDNTVACKIASGNSCSIDKLKTKSAFNLIQPGGNTTCMNSNYPFLFSVELGTSTKDVLLYFQAGGVCLNQDQYNSFYCNVCPVKGTRGGIIDASNRKNLFKTYTIIEIYYCSGDFHIGNKVAPFSDSKGPTKFSGQANVMSVLNWIQDQQVKGFLPEVFNNFLIAGASAGSGGAQFWSNEVIKMFKANNYAVVADSFFTYLPVNALTGESYEMQLFDEFGTCESQILPLPHPLFVKCATRTLTSANTFDYMISQNPKVPFYGVVSKNDLVQISIHNTLATMLSIPNSQYSVTGPEFYNDIYANVLVPLNNNRNFLIFIAQGRVHTYINHDYLYTTTETGCTSGLLDVDGIANGCSLFGSSGHFFLTTELNVLPLQVATSIVTNVCVDVQPTDNELCGVFALPKQFPTAVLVNPGPPTLTAVPTKRPSFRHGHENDHDHHHHGDNHDGHGAEDGDEEDHPTESKITSSDK